MVKSIRKGDIIEATKYTFHQEMALVDLSHYSEHRRLATFFHKGCECANRLCERVGTRLIDALDRQGNSHVDVYTDDLILMTVDHYVPRSKGGKDTLDNKIPLCQYCNTWKGNRFDGLVGFTEAAKESSNGFNLSFKKELKKRRAYGRSWRKLVRKLESFDFYAKDDMLIWWKLLDKQDLHRIL